MELKTKEKQLIELKPISQLIDVNGKGEYVHMFECVVVKGKDKLGTEYFVIRIAGTLVVVERNQLKGREPILLPSEYSVMFIPADNRLEVRKKRRRID
ncbi:MAG: hypothetical protein ABI758_02695 [Candidatus Woesebacteria bacterium]